MPQRDDKLALAGRAVVVRPSHVVTDNRLDKPNAGLEVVFLSRKQDQVLWKPLATLRSDDT